ncbi:MAG: hypothetical protein EOO62_36915, partial [Hymenobacter sp.]
MSQPVLPSAALAACRLALGRCLLLLLSLLVSSRLARAAEETDLAGLKRRLGELRAAARAAFE